MAADYNYSGTAIVTSDDFARVPRVITIGFTDGCTHVSTHTFDDYWTVEHVPVLQIPAVKKSWRWFDRFRSFEPVAVPECAGQRVQRGMRRQERQPAVQRQHSKRRAYLHKLRRVT